MQRKPSYPVANCSIKMPDCSLMDMPVCDDENEQQVKRQHLINFAHTQWGFNNWSWSVTKQDLDFVDFANGKYCAGVVAFVSIKLKSLDIYRENIGYATSAANTKGLAIYKSRKCAVTNALRETLLSFGGKVASELLESLETVRSEVPNVNAAGANTPHVSASLVGAPLVSAPSNAPICSVPKSPVTIPDNENNQNIANRLEPKTSPAAVGPRKEEPRLAAPPVARAMPMPAPAPTALPRAPPVHPVHAPHPAPAPLRPNSNDLKTGFEGMTEEEARAERKRRQRLAQEEFKQRQLMKNAGLDEKHELSKCSSSIDKLLMDIPTQDIVIEQTGPMADTGKRKSPTPHNSRAKRRSSFNKLDIVED